MDVAYISAISALTGSVIGAATSGLSSFLTERVRARSAQLVQDRLRREELYDDFIMAASRVYADAVTHDEPQVPDLVALYALVSRIRVLSSAEIVRCAENITRGATDMYFMPNRTVRELHEMVKSEAIDPLKEFSEHARRELRVLGGI